MDCSAGLKYDGLADELIAVKGVVPSNVDNGRLSSCSAA